MVVFIRVYPAFVPYLRVTRRCGWLLAYDRAANPPTGHVVFASLHSISFPARLARMLAPRTLRPSGAIIISLLRTKAAIKNI